MVHEPGYREAKATTALTLLPDILLVPPGTPREVAPPNVALDSRVFKRLWNVAHGRGPDQESV